MNPEDKMNPEDQRTSEIKPNETTAVYQLANRTEIEMKNIASTVKRVVTRFRLYRATVLSSGPMR